MQNLEDAMEKGIAGHIEGQSIASGPTSPTLTCTTESNFSSHFEATKPLAGMSYGIKHF